MFIVSVSYKRPVEEVDVHHQAHVDFLKQEYGKGSFIVSGKKIPRTGGIIMSNLRTRDELEAVLAKDPFKIADVAEYDITEFNPTMAAEGYEILKVK